ncbi:MAG: murein biosynthesis integral membrane protein MurJ, partial [Clostridia bacterium]|nr:murein biosynthesis integral membrane protein MurJ [Clostridia bacterium]
MSSAKKTIRTAGFMIVATLLAKFMGMYRDILFAALYGTGAEAVAYSTASRIPLLFFDITLGSAISSSFIPVFNEFLQKGKKEEAKEFANSFLNIIFLITSGLCAIGIVLRSPIVNLLGSGLPLHVKQLAEALVVIMFPSMIFTALAYSLTGVLQSYGSFHAPAAISLVSNGIMVGYLIFAKNRFGIQGVSYAMLVAWAFQLVVLLPSLVKKKYRYQLRIQLKNPGLKKALFLAIPILISSWVQPINTMVNMFLASFLNGGQAVSALDYANKLYIIFVGVLTYAISNLIFPSISRLAADQTKKAEFTEIMKTAMGSVLFILLPIMIIFLAERTEIVRLVYERGAFGPEQTHFTATALLWYSFGMLGYGMQEMLNKAFYAGQNGKTPMRVSVFGIAVNVAFSFLLVRGLNLGIGGLPMAASIAANVIAVVLAVILNKQYKLFDRSFCTNLGKLIVSGAVMMGSLYIVKSVCSFGDDMLGKLLAFGVHAIIGF